MISSLRPAGAILAFVVAAALAPPARAVDGVVEINQARALAGDAASGDSAGFPVTIDANGSYRLTGDLTVPDENTTAIQLGPNALYVTIDLNGFSILGPNSCTIPPTVTCTAGSLATGDGIAGPLNAANYNDSKVRVVNGTIRGMGRYGIDVAKGEAEAVHALHNRVYGIFFHGSGSLVTSSEVTSNGSTGIVLAGNGGVVRGCAVGLNGLNGIFAYKASITNNTVISNVANGVYATDSTVTGNEISSNGVTGVNGDDLTVLDNLISGNTGLGIGHSPATGYVGYGRNVLVGNNGGSANQQVASGNVQLPAGSNVCGSIACPP